jgi:hypothetical protein
VEYATLEWVDRTNNRRLLGPSGNLPPAEFEATNSRQQDESAMVALSEVKQSPEFPGLFNVPHATVKWAKMASPGV